MNIGTYIFMAVGAIGVLLALAGAVWVLVQARRHPARRHARLYDMEDANRVIGGGL
ncbi:MAG TPA: hypothetical protein VKU60_02660 [Chloroflexota bacterium]|nr:hypothetical protein [Chloroflexota bacterium]